MLGQIVLMKGKMEENENNGGGNREKLLKPRRKR